jgi:hypothetical protein
MISQKGNSPRDSFFTILHPDQVQELILKLIQFEKDEMALANAPAEKVAEDEETTPAILQGSAAGSNKRKIPLSVIMVLSVIGLVSIVLVRKRQGKW